MMFEAKSLSREFFNHSEECFKGFLDWEKIAGVCYLKYKISFFLGELCALCNITRELISAGYLISTQKTY